MRPDAGADESKTLVHRAVCLSAQALSYLSVRIAAASLEHVSQSERDIVRADLIRTLTPAPRRYRFIDETADPHKEVFLPSSPDP